MELKTNMKECKKRDLKGNIKSSFGKKERINLDKKHTKNPIQHLVNFSL